MVLDVLSIKSIAGTPLRYNDKVVGAITVASTKANDINGNDRALIGYMANLITTAIVKAQLYGEEKKARIKLSALEDISEAGLTTLGISELLGEISERMSSSLRLDWSAIFIFENRNGRMVVDHTTGNCRFAIGKDISSCCEPFEKVLSDDKPKAFRNGQLSQLKPFFRDTNIKAAMMVPIALRQDRACIIILGRRTATPFSETEIDLMETLVFRSALAIENALLFTKLERAYLETVESLVKAIEAKDTYTCGHSEQVATIAKQIALAMGIDQEQAERIYVAGLLHDVGKIGISSNILMKPSALSSEEYDEIKLHTVKGHEILKPIGSLEDLADIALQHHERFDGTGYPNGHRGEEIRLEARILALADAFQAMISNRPYRDSLGLEVAADEIKKGMGSQFDPKIAEVFLAILTEQLKSLKEKGEQETEEKIPLQPAKSCKVKT